MTSVVGALTLFAKYIILVNVIGFQTCLDVVKCSDDETSEQNKDSHEPRGHLKALGEQSPKEGVIETVEGFPDAKTFFSEYVQESQPIVFKNAAKKIPAFNLWTDEYLATKYGEVSVDVEVGKKENRSDKSVKMSLKQFLQEYKTSNIYMVQNAVKPLQDELSLPPCLQCGGFEKGLEISVVWLSSGDTRSVLHHDDVDNIHCLLDGSKSVYLVDRKYDYLVEEDEWEMEGTYSYVDVAAVDLHKVPSLAHTPWWQATINPGDCLFIPYKWYHSVYSPPGRSLAVNLFFAHLLWLDDDHCAAEGIQAESSYQSLSNYKINSFHPEVTATQKIIGDVFSEFEGDPEVDLDYALDMWEDIMSPQEVQSVFEVVDTNKDMILSWQEIYSVDILQLVMEFPFLLPENVDDGYYESGDWEDSIEHPPYYEVGSDPRDEL